MEKNWYIELELEFWNNANRNIEEIKEIISKKRNEWTGKSKNILEENSEKYKELLKYSAEKILEEIQENGNKMITEAKEMLSEEMEKYLKSSEKKGMISRETIKNISDKIKEKIKIKNLEEIIENKIKNERKLEIYDDRFYNSFQGKIKEKNSLYEKTKDYLEKLNYKNAINFLESEGISINLDYREIKDEIINKRQNAPKKSDEKTSYTNKLYTAIEEALINNNVLRKYEKYIKYKNVEEILKNILNLKIENALVLNEKETEEKIKEIDRNLNRLEESKGIFAFFCDKNSITFSLGNEYERKEEERNRREWERRNWEERKRYERREEEEKERERREYERREWERQYQKEKEKRNTIILIVVIIVGLIVIWRLSRDNDNSVGTTQNQVEVSNKKTQENQNNETENIPQLNQETSNTAEQQVNETQETGNSLESVVDTLRNTSFGDYTLWGMAKAKLPTNNFDIIDENNEVRVVNKMDNRIRHTYSYEENADISIQDYYNRLVRKAESSGGQRIYKLLKTNSRYFVVSYATNDYYHYYKVVYNSDYSSYITLEINSPREYDYVPGVGKLDIFLKLPNWFMPID